jgi:hypothetical protein
MYKGQAEIKFTWYIILQLKDLHVLWISWRNLLIINQKIQDNCIIVCVFMEKNDLVWRERTKTAHKLPAYLNQKITYFDSYVI